MDYLTIKRVPDGYWNSYENQLHFRNYLASKFNYSLENQSDWYALTTKNIRDYGGNGLLNSKYNGRTLDFMNAVFPQWTWHPWLFHEPLKKYWKEPNIQKDYLFWLGNKLGWTSKKDYYKLTTPIIQKNSGTGLLTIYKSSIVKIVASIMDSPPEGDDEWYPWLFDGSTPNGYWKDIENQKKYADWLYKHLNFTKMEDWYSVTQDTFRENYGSGIVLSKIYNSSHIAFLQTVYKGAYEFYPWLFKQTTQGFWKDYDNQLSYMKWLSKQLNYTKEEDWYSITRDIIRKYNGSGLLAHYYNDNYLQMIIKLNPHLSFDEQKFNIHKTEKKVELWFRKKNIKYKKQFNICKGKKNGVFKVDFLLPDYNIAVEIDGAQHFKKVRNWLDPIIQVKRDVYKMKQMVSKGYKCIRLVQEEIYANDETFLDKYLLCLLKKYEDTQPIYLSVHEENKNIYEKHDSSFKNDNISFKELYICESDGTE